VALAYEGLASIYSDRGNHDGARYLLKKVRQTDPNDPDVDAAEGLALVRAGRWREAEPLLNQALTRDPQNENALNSLGLIAWQYKRNLEEAAALFTRALAIHTAGDDFRASLHNNLGGVYGDLGQFPKAIEQFKAAVAILPDDPQYHTNLASAFGAAGEYDNAAAEASAALRIAPDYPPARAVLQQLRTR
jgi:tetratricopeptide (TPR) repeat protein